MVTKCFYFSLGEPKETVLQGSGIYLEKVLQNGKENQCFQWKSSASETAAL